MATGGAVAVMLIRGGMHPVLALVFAFIITSVAAFYGYYAYGGALEVGKASTKAVVNSSILILLFNLILTNLMLV